MSSSAHSDKTAVGLRTWISAWLPVLIGIGLIASESTASMGADHTSGPLRLLFQALFGHVTDVRWEEIHFLIRKCGHFVGYGLLGLVWLRAWRMTAPRLRFVSCAGLALLCTGMVACCDEWHQSFLPNRGASASDVLLDCGGVLALEIIFYGFMRIFLREHPMQEG
jgi:VanZ family protein